MKVAQLASQLFLLAQDGHGDDELRLHIDLIDGSCLYCVELKDVYRDTDGKENIVVIRNYGKDRK